MEYLFIYALQIADALHDLEPVLLAGLCTAIFLKVMIVTCETPTECKIAEVLNPIINKSLIVIGIILVVTFILPTKQTLILWSGTYYGKAAVNHVVNTDKYKKISELIDLKLDSLIKEERGKN